MVWHFSGCVLILLVFAVCSSSDISYGEWRGIGSEDCVWWSSSINLGKQSFLDIKIFNNSFNNKVRSSSSLLRRFCPAERARIGPLFRPFNPPYSANNVINHFGCSGGIIFVLFLCNSGQAVGNNFPEIPCKAQSWLHCFEPRIFEGSLVQVHNHHSLANSCWHLGNTRPHLASSNYGDIPTYTNFDTGWNDDCKKETTGQFNLAM